MANSCLNCSDVFSRVFIISFLEYTARIYRIKPWNWISVLSRNWITNKMEYAEWRHMYRSHETEFNVVHVSFSDTICIQRLIPLQDDAKLSFWLRSSILLGHEWKTMVLMQLSYLKSWIFMRDKYIPGTSNCCIGTFAIQNNWQLKKYSEPDWIYALTSRFKVTRIF